MDSERDTEAQAAAAAVEEGGGGGGGGGQQDDEPMGIHQGSMKSGAGDEDAQEGLYSGQSVIEEVALTVPVSDDPSLQVWTFRMWVLGLISCAGLAFINQFFYYRTAPLIINAITAQILTLFFGRLMAAVIPKSWTWVNPGPFNIKEHVLIFIFANVGSGFSTGPAYAVDIVTLTNNPTFYNSYMPFLAALIVVNTTQALGYGWAGLLRRYLVDPAHMWWPTNMINVSLFHTLHDKDDRESGQMGRLPFFAWVALGSFFYYALPGYLFTLLTSFAWVCFIWPDSIVAQQVGSGYSGLGVGALSFDWATATAFLGSPLATPWWAIVNVFLGFAVFMFCVQPFIYWYNVYDARTFEFFGSDLFNADGSPYDVSLVVDPSTISLNSTAFDIYGAPNLSVFFAFTYGFSFAALTAMVVHVALWHGKELWQQSGKAIREGDADVHTRIMKANYKDCPGWWFIVLGVLCIGLAILAVEVWRDTLQLPWWGILFATGLAGSLTLPIGIIAATTNQVPGLNVITELIMGYLLPGKPVANVLFKTYGYISTVQAVSFLQDFKLGTYMKIPPRSMFLVQLLGTVVGSTVNLGTAWWQLNSIENICDVQALPPGSPWTCPNSRVFFDASVIWGLIGPKNIFGSNGRYNAQNWWWLVGAVAPVPFWALYKFVFPKKKWLRLVNMPIFFNSSGIAPPAGTINFTSWFAWGFFFQYYLFNYRKALWSRYNYLFSAGMQTGIAFMAVLLFFALQNNNLYLDWWGNQAECPIATCPTTNSASLALNAAGGNLYTGDPCPVWG